MDIRAIQFSTIWDDNNECWECSGFSFDENENATFMGSMLGETPEDALGLLIGHLIDTGVVSSS